MDTKISDLLVELGKLQAQKKLLEMRGFVAKGREHVDGAVNRVSEEVAKVGKRFADSYEKSEDRRNEKKNYKDSLNKINEEYEAEASKILETLEKYETLKSKALTVGAVRKSALKAIIKNAGKTNIKDKELSPEQRIEMAQQKLEEDKKQLESSSRSNKGISDMLGRCDENIANQKEKLEHLKEERQKKLDELTEDRSLVKQSPISRFLGLFGAGAAKRVESIQNAMNGRTLRALDAQKDLKEQVNSNINSIEEVNKIIEEEIKSKLNNTIEMVKAEVGVRIDNAKDFGKNLSNYIGASLEVIGNSSKAMLQKGVGNILKGMQEFASGEGDSWQKVEDAKKRQQKVMGKDNPIGER